MCPEDCSRRAAVAPVAEPGGAPRTAPTAPAGEAVQRVMKVRRDYNGWVASETLEDYALRFTPRSFRKWSALRVANTAFGASSFLVLEAVGAALLLDHGAVNAFWAILATGLLIFAIGLPISYYAATYGVDMDLLTRGAGFGYLGSTITSLIYASFTFIFFALEAAIMAYALDLAFDIPPAWGYLICAVVVIPLVTHGVTAISRLQVWTQPLWLLLLVVPYAWVFWHDPQLLSRVAGYAGEHAPPGAAPAFTLLGFGTAVTVGIALVTQMGEQADYLRFMPEKTPANRKRWWAALLIGGPGWVIPGVLKMLGGAVLAWLALSLSVTPERAVDPNQMYLAAWGVVFPERLGWAIAITALFVVVSQLKINVTNAYAGSLAWSNFFARLTHSHPGRVVWVVFNTAIALMLMELDLFQGMSRVLGLYGNIAIAWIGAVVADLVVNKPLGLSPPGIEFKRAHLHDINPVGVGAMGIASALSIAAHLGAFGPLAQAYSAVIAMVTAFASAPLIAWATGGRYYLARKPRVAGDGATCVICERPYEGEDMARCPAYQGPICSLCCSLDARCGDLCKPHGRLATQWQGLLTRLLPRSVQPYLASGLSHYLLVMGVVVPLLALAFWAVYQHELGLLAASSADRARELWLGHLKVFAAVLLLAGVVVWWLVLTQKTRAVAQEESNRQTQALMREIESHRRTDLQLQHARQAAEAAREQADHANQAKTRYITTISHELRTPLNSILGYAQLLAEDEDVPEHRRQAVHVIRRGGDHLLSLIEGTLDIARIEGGKLTLDPRPMRFADAVQQIARLFELQAAEKGIAFVHETEGELPAAVRADERRWRQILINVLGNAVKFTREGRVVFRVSHAREMARFDIEDTGPGIAPDELDRIFEPFARGSGSSGAASAGGTGLGLTIAKMLTDLMGGEMSVRSEPGRGTCFSIRLFLPALHGPLPPALSARPPRVGYTGPRRRVLVVDNEEVDRDLARRWLEPLGFEVAQAASGDAALALLADGPRPDAVLMDLAMPGLDGWATLRAMHERGLDGLPLAIVSANAFDKGLDHEVGLKPAVRPEDFLVKPVRRDELLDWLARRLGLTWVEASTTAPAAPPAAALVLPPAAELRALQAFVDLGYLRGVLAKLDEIEAAHTASAAFVARLRPLARGFKLDALGRELRDALARAPA
ncbi:ATP-binding protein [Aquabacterium sp. J223]|uniref:hybrid sensor histidine kinase/response regulator n=1 Tax=Aquabacterium sp. J223 TaxID=2898431 RepID=UPI003916F21F